MEGKNNQPAILLARLEETVDLQSRSPTAMLGLTCESENILSIITEFLKDGSHTIEEVRSLITAEDAQKVAEDYLRLQREGEAQLYAFTDNTLLQPLRNKRLPGLTETPGAVEMNYRVIAHCPATGKQFENNAQIDHARLKRYRGLEYRLADEIAVCPACEETHQADVSFMEYTLRDNQSRYSRLEQAVLKARTMAEAAKRSGKNTRKLQEAEARLEEARAGLDSFMQRPFILRISARVKGSESLIYKIADKVTRLDELVPDEQKQGDERQPTAIKDYLGVGIWALGEAGRDRLLRHFHELSLEMRDDLRIIGLKDYWGPPRTEPLSDGREVLKGRKENPDGTVRHDAYHILTMYAGLPIEVQIMRPDMRIAHEHDHKFYRERLRDRRRTLQEQFGVNYNGLVRLLQELLRGKETGRNNYY